MIDPSWSAMMTAHFGDMRDDPMTLADARLVVRSADPTPADVARAVLVLGGSPDPIDQTIAKALNPGAAGNPRSSLCDPTPAVMAGGFSKECENE